MLESSHFNFTQIADILAMINGEKPTTAWETTRDPISRVSNKPVVADKPKGIASDSPTLNTVSPVMSSKNGATRWTSTNDRRKRGTEEQAALDRVKSGRISKTTAKPKEPIKPDPPRPAPTVNQKKLSPYLQKVHDRYQQSLENPTDEERAERAEMEARRIRSLELQSMKNPLSLFSYNATGAASRSTSSNSATTNTRKIATHGSGIKKSLGRRSPPTGALPTSASTQTVKKVWKAATATTGWKGTARPEARLANGKNKVDTVTNSSRDRTGNSATTARVTKPRAPSQPNYQKSDFASSDEESELNDFIEDDEIGEPSSRRRFDYESDGSSDMEAGLDDIDNEETQAARAARLEDQREEEALRRAKRLKEKRKNELVKRSGRD